MLSTFKNALKIPDLRKKLLWTFFFVAIYRIGIFIPVPGIDTVALERGMSQTGGLVDFYDLISGGAFKTFSIFAMGVVPYINASIIMQLLTIAIPQLEQLQKEGEEGRKKIQKITRYSSIVLGAIQAYGSYVMIYNKGAIVDRSVFNTLMIMLTLVTASTFLLWLSDQITVKGLGNGTSIIIFVGIVSRFPTTGYQIAGLLKAETVSVVEIAVFILGAAALLVSVIMMSLGERRISVQYAGKTVGNRSFKGQTTHIPINLTATAVIAIIFAMSVMQFPGTIAQFWPTSKISMFITGSNYSIFKSNSWQYALVYSILVVFFTWFYTQVTFKPDEMAENMHKSSGFIPGIRPGQPTANHIERVLGRVAIIGGTYAAIIAIIPILVEGYTNFKGISFGGTALLILVGVALDSVRQIESQLVMRHYQGFLK